MTVCELRNVCANFTEDTTVRICTAGAFQKPVILYESNFINIPKLFLNLNITMFLFREKNTILEIHY